MGRNAKLAKGVWNGHNIGGNYNDTLDFIHCTYALTVAGSGILNAMGIHRLNISVHVSEILFTISLTSEVIFGSYLNSQDIC